MASAPLPCCPHIFCLFHFFKKDIILFFGRCLDIPSSQSHCGWYLATRLSHSKRQPPLVITPKSQNSSCWLLCGLTCQKQPRLVRENDHEKDIFTGVSNAKCGCYRCFYGYWLGYNKSLNSKRL